MLQPIATLYAHIFLTIVGILKRMTEREPAIEHQQPVYSNLDALLEQIPGKNGDACKQIYRDFIALFQSAPGSSHNHQAWPGGYYDHVTEAMNIAATLYDTLSSARTLPFKKSDGLLVMFLHDLEKPFKYQIDEQGSLIDNPDIPDKAARAAKRNQLIQQYGIELDDQQLNALKFVEGVRDQDYTPGVRLMGELAALCHCADILSARLWYNYPLSEGQDEWHDAARINPAAARFILKTETPN